MGTKLTIQELQYVVGSICTIMLSYQGFGSFDGNEFVLIGVCNSLQIVFSLSIWYVSLSLSVTHLPALEPADQRPYYPNRCYVRVIINDDSDYNFF